MSKLLNLAEQRKRRFDAYITVCAEKTEESLNALALLNSGHEVKVEAEVETLKPVEIVSFVISHNNRNSKKALLSFALTSQLNERNFSFENSKGQCSAETATEIHYRGNVSAFLDVVNKFLKNNNVAQINPLDLPLNPNSLAVGTGEVIYLAAQRAATLQRTAFIIGEALTAKAIEDGLVKPGDAAKIQNFITLKAAATPGLYDFNIDAAANSACKNLNAKLLGATHESMSIDALVTAINDFVGADYEIDGSRIPSIPAAKKKPGKIRNLLKAMCF